MSVFVNNLDDFILPSQDCINPFILSKNKDSQQQQQDHDNSSSNSKKSRKILLSTDDTISEYENYGNPLTSNTTVVEPNLINVKYDSNNKKIASVSLNDCLACRYSLYISSDIKTY